nr:MAG TPA: hypothetical protein [Caudoviricetes sp.]
MTASCTKTAETKRQQGKEEYITSPTSGRSSRNAL